MSLGGYVVELRDGHEFVYDQVSSGPSVVDPSAKIQVAFEST